MIKHTNSSFFTMVAKGDDEKPALVPALILETAEDVKRFIEGLRLKSIRDRVRAEMLDARSVPDIRNAQEILKNIS